jgi:hypothetical protein
MRKSLYPISGVIVIAALAWWGWAHGPIDLPRSDEIPIPTAYHSFVSLPEASDSAGSTGDGTTASFAHLSVGETRTVDFAIDEATRSRLTAREQADQLRDWLLFTVVSDAGLTADELNRALYDVPTIRHGHMRPVANFEYGTVRSCFIGNDRVVTVIPRVADDARRRDLLAHIGDEHRKNLGTAPGKLLVFEYELEPARLLATLTRRPDLDGRELFSAAYGYQERLIGAAGDLGEFLQHADDVTFARLEPRGLRLGGRKLQQYRGLRAEDVAAVWQAQRKLRASLEAVESRFKSEQDDVRKKWQAKLDALNARQRADTDLPGTFRVPSTPGGSPGDLFPGLNGGDDATKDDDLEALARAFQQRSARRSRRFAAPADGEASSTAAEIQAAYDREAEELARRQALEYRGMHLTDHTGFSLDPDYDYDGLQAWFAGKPSERLKTLASRPGAPITAAEVDEAARGLRGAAGEHRVVPLLKLLDKAKRGFSSPLGALVVEGINHDVRNKFQYQAARYDGDLQGTEVGMVLFYTDLLAKLWVSVDYSAPRDVIAEFRTGPDGGVPPVFKAETITQPSTRLWFGPEDRAYQLLTNRTGVVLARCATRIYAASSDPLTPGVEVPPTYQADRRMGWWNDHFEEVAAYEEEYERLNEYIKWSVILGWLEAQDAMDRLGFLRDVSVDHSAWFPDWVKKHPELRFKQWERVPFFERGAKNSRTESLPILESRPFANFGEKPASWTISGGVSGARPSDIRARPFLPERVTGSGGLSLRGVDLKSLGTSGGKLTTLRGTSHAFEAPSIRRATMTVTPKEGSALRSTHGDLASTEFRRSITRADRELRVYTTAGFGDVGELRIAPRGNGFAASYGSRDVDAGQAIVRDISRNADAGAFLAGDARVAAAVEAGDGAWLVKLHQSSRWIKVVPDRSPSPAIGAGWDSRVADTTVGAKSYNVAWAESAAVREQLGSGEYLRIDVGPSADRRPTIHVLARGPPEGARRLRVTGGPAEFPASIDPASGSVYVRMADLPRDVAASPEGLTNLFRGTRATAEGTLKRIECPLPPADTPPLIAHLESGRKGEAARLLAADPEGSRRLLEADLRGRLQPIDDLLAQDKPGEALDLTLTGLRVHPDNPELLLRAGEAHIARGRPAEAARLDLAAQSTETRQSLHAEIDRLLNRSRLGSARREYLRTRRGELAARDLQIQQKTKATVNAVVDGDRVTLSATFAARPTLEAAQAAEVAAADILYADDSLGLNNLDWSPAARQKTIQQALQSPGVELYVMAVPDPIFQQVPGKVTFEAGAGAPRSTYSHVSSPSSGGEDGDDEEDDGTGQQPGRKVGRRKSARTYFLTAKARPAGVGTPLPR